MSQWTRDVISAFSEGESGNTQKVKNLNFLNFLQNFSIYLTKSRNWGKIQEIYYFSIYLK